MALIGTIALNMTVKTAALAKGLKTGATAIASFAKGAAQLGSAIGSKLIGAKNTEGIKSIGQAFLDARTDAQTLSKSGLLDLSNRLRIVRNLASDLAPALGGMAGRGLRGLAMLGGVGARLAASGLVAVGAGATFAGRAMGRAFRFAEQLAAKLAIVGGVAGAAFYKVAKLASDLGEQTNRAQIMFGDATGKVIAQSKLMAGAFGISRAEFLKTTSAMAGMFQGIGYTKDASADLSVHFLKLATDLSSIANIPVADALEKIQSGLAGEVRPLREVGVFLSEAAIKEKAAAMGIAKLGTELTEAQKVQARVALITEKLAYANGDLARTADSAENATRGFLGRLQNLAETVGTALLPIVGSAMSQLQVGVEVLSILWEEWTASAVAGQSNVVGAVGETAGAMGWLQKSVIFVADAWQTVKGVFGVVQSYITAGLGKIVGAIGLLAGALDAVAEKLHLTKTGLGDFLSTYAEDLSRLSAEQFAEAGKALTAPSAAGAIGDYFARAQDRIKAMRTEAMRPGVDVTKLAPVGGTPEKAVEPKFASAAAAGSAEATNAILRSRFGGGGAAKGPAEATAKNTAKSVDLLTQAVGALNRLAGAKAEAAFGALGALF